MPPESERHAPGVRRHERVRDKQAVRLWLQLEHRSIEVPLGIALDWPDPVRAEIADYVLTLSELEAQRLELRSLREVPPALREYTRIGGARDASA